MTKYKKEVLEEYFNEIDKLSQNRITSAKIYEYEKMLKGMIKNTQEGKTYYDWYFPIAKNYKINYSKDFGQERTYGGERSHKGNDIFCNEGTPIISVEEGIIENIGWNELGGWRIGIRSLDKERYWYYAHMRKTHPYIKTLKIGSHIKGGQVIGYVGSTGYSSSISENSMPENLLAIDNQFESHLHIGVYINIDGTNVAYDPYTILRILEYNRVSTVNYGDEKVAVAKSINNRIFVNTIFTIGKLSEKYESSGDPGMIANNSGDIGGKSYGAYQFAVNTGTVSRFLMWLEEKDTSLYRLLINAKTKDINTYSYNFDNTWRKIANEKREYFYSLQNEFVMENYYEPVVEYFKEEYKIDFTNRSKTLQSVIWSTSVQHGVNGAISIILKSNLKADDQDIIIDIYTERQKINIYFISSSQNIKNSVWNRFQKELEDALRMLTIERGG